jgi:cyanophycinase
MLRKIALLGGDEFRPGCEFIDRAVLNSTCKSSPKVLIVPTAAALENPTLASLNGISYFSNLDADASSLMVLDSEDANNQELLKPLIECDVVYFTGGNPRYLIDVIVNSVFLERIYGVLDRGGVVAGSSAGAMMLGRYMSFEGWYSGTGVAGNVVILPHHESIDPDFVAEKFSEESLKSIIGFGIDSQTGFFKMPLGWTVFGEGNVIGYSQGEWVKYSDGEIIPA